MRRSLALLLILAASPALLACGDDDGGGSAEDEKAVRTAVTAFAADGPDPCFEVATKALIAKISGPDAICKTKNPKPGKAAGAAVSDVKVDGDEATAVLAQRTSGMQLKGEIELVKAGDAWQVNELRKSFLRSLMVGVLPQGFAQSQSEELKPVTAKASLRRCLADAYDRLPEGQLEEIGYAALGNRSDTPARGRFNTLLIDCILADRDGVKAMRGLTESGIRETLTARKVDADCVIDKLRVAVSDAEVAAALKARAGGASADTGAAAVLQTEAKKAERECR